MTLEFALFVAAGAFTSGFVAGLAGFGVALFSLGWLLQVMTPFEAVVIAIVLSIECSIPGLWISYRYIEPQRVARLLIPALAGIPVGLYLLASVDEQMLKLVIAAFLLFYGGYFVMRRGLPQVTKDYLLLEGAIGFASGILGALAGLSGVLPTVWASMKPWPKLKIRGLLQPFSFIILCISAVALVFQGAFSETVGLGLLVAVPTSAVAAWFGIIVFKRLSDTQFQRLLIALIFLSGIGIIARELLLA